MTTAIRFPALVLAGLLATLLGGCGRPPHPPAARGGLALGPYRATLLLPGGELPFGFTVAERSGRKIIYVINGAEAVPVTEFEEDGPRLTLRFPGYANRIEAIRNGAGYSGSAVLIRRGGREVRLPFQLTPGRQYRFYPEQMKDPPRVAGRWAVTFTSRDGSETPAIAELKQIGARLFGTVLEPGGDHRFLEGDVQGDEIRLSRFDGGSAFLYSARILPDGTLAGSYWSGNWSQQALSARRDDAAVLADPAAAAGAAPVPPAFQFPDLGNRPVSFADARFRGKAVIVAVGGSWCPNCHDESAFLVPLYRRLHEQGLEIVYLQFEHFGNFDDAVAANRRFVAKFGIDWPVLIAGISDRDEASRKLPWLGRVFAFPTTAVIDRNGKVRQVHSGFSGPATGQHYEDFRREFTALVESLLAEGG